MQQTDKLGDKVQRDILISTSKVNFKNSLPVCSFDFPQKIWFKGLRFSFDHRVLSDIVSIALLTFTFSFTTVSVVILQGQHQITSGWTPYGVYTMHYSVNVSIRTERHMTEFFQQVFRNSTSITPGKLAVMWELATLSQVNFSMRGYQQKFCTS